MNIWNFNNQIHVNKNSHKKHVKIQHMCESSLRNNTVDSLYCGTSIKMEVLAQIKLPDLNLNPSRAISIDDGT